MQRRNLEGRATSQAKVVHLQSVRSGEIAAYAHFGALLRSARQNTHGITQQDLAEAFSRYCSSQTLAKDLGLSLPRTPKKRLQLNRKQIGKLEDDLRAPAFDELLPLYLAMTAGCGIEVTPDDRSQYVHLARRKIEGKRLHREHIPPDLWDRLTQLLFQADGEDADPNKMLELVTFEEREEEETQQKEARLEGNRREKVAEARYQIEQTPPIEEIELGPPIDTSYIIGRGHVINKQLSYLQSQSGTTRVKLSALFALTGTGKTSCLKLMRKHLAESKKDVFHYEFDTRSKDKTPPDHLHDLLAKLLLKFDVLQGEAVKPPSLQERIQQVIKEIARTKDLVLILDDFQVALEQSGELGAEWAQFLQEFVEGNHLTTIYLASRIRPRWRMKERAFIAEMELLPLPVNVGVQVWRDLGFVEEDEATLQEATRRCGGNPGMMGMVSLHVQKPVISFDWTTLDENDPEETGLKRFVRDPHYLSNEELALDVFPFLEEILATRITSEARHLITSLAVTPIPLAPVLLRHLCKAPPGPLYQELFQASLLSSDQHRIYLLPLVAESVRQQLSKEQIFSCEEQIIDVYNTWLEVGEFRDDAEQTAVVTETIVLYLQHHRLLEAAHLLLLHGWRCLSFGHASRLARVARSVMTDTAHFDWQADPANFAGGTLILYQMGRKTGLETRAEDYKHIYQLVQEGKIVVSDTEVTHLAHHIMQHAVEERQFQQASILCDKALHVLSTSETSKRLDIEIVAQALYAKAHFLGSWSDDKRVHGEKEESTRLNEEAISMLIQGIQHLREWEQRASPLKKRNIHFKLARYLHSLGYRMRLQGNIEKAREALDACLQLKQTGSATPLSLAVTYGEYAQLLCAQGKFVEALHDNAQARQIVQELLDAGDKSDQVGGDMRMHLVECGLILLQQANLEDAKKCFSEALSYTQKSRRLYYDIAEEKLKMIAQRTQLSVSHYRLDEQWFSDYESLADLDEIKALTPAGPFTQQEHNTWRALEDRTDEDAKAQRSAILVETLRRALALARKEQREPEGIWYPMIPIEDVRRRKRSFQQQRARIEEHEENALVRQIYKEAIHKQVTMLTLIEAVYNNDMETMWQCNQSLYPCVEPEEMKYALSLFIPMINRGLRTEQTHDLATQLLRLLQRWQVPLDGIEIPKKIERAEKLRNVKPPTTTISSKALKLFMEEVLRIYGFQQCRVEIDPTRDEAYVQASSGIFLADKDEPIAKAIELVGEELETHLLRGQAGYKSQLAILGSGLPGYESTDEGLAYHYIEQIAKSQQRNRSFSWIGTLSVGLASGVISSPLSFRQLSGFLELAFSIRNILNGGFETREQAILAAIQEAEERAKRTFRGITNLADPSIRGKCSPKDNLYLHGYRQVAQALKDGSQERLLVGKISVDHLPLMEELAIITPTIRHRQIALQPDLGTWMKSFEER